MWANILSSNNQAMSTEQSLLVLVLGLQQSVPVVDLVAQPRCLPADLFDAGPPACCMTFNLINVSLLSKSFWWLGVE